MFYAKYCHISQTYSRPLIVSRNFLFFSMESDSRSFCINCMKENYWFYNQFKHRLSISERSRITCKKHTLPFHTHHNKWPIMWKTFSCPDDLMYDDRHQIVTMLTTSHAWSISTWSPHRMATFRKRYSIKESEIPRKLVWGARQV